MERAGGCIYPSPHLVLSIANGPFSDSAPGAVEYTQFVLEMKLQLGYPIRRVEGRVVHVFALIDPRGHAQKSNRRRRRTRY